MPSRFTTLAARISPLVIITSAACAGLALYAFLIDLPFWQQLSTAGTLLLLGLCLPWLFERQREDDWVAAGVVTGLSLLILILGNPQALWIVLVITTLCLATVLSESRLWLALAFMWLGWLSILLISISIPLTTLLAFAISRGIILSVIGIWARSAIRQPPVSVAQTKNTEDLSSSAVQRLSRASSRLRVLARRQDMLEEIVSAAKAIGPFEYAAIGDVDWRSGSVCITVVLGASGRTLGASEGLTLTWSEIAPLLKDTNRINERTYVVSALPFRSVPQETYAVIPMYTAKGEITGILAVATRTAEFTGFASLLELLVLQGEAALETMGIQAKLAQRLEQTAAEMNRSTADVQRALSQTEQLYHVIRALSAILEPQQLLDRALMLISQSTQAERGGVMLADPRSGRLRFGTNIERHLTQSEAVALERGQGLAGWVVENQAVAIIPNTAEDERWLVRNKHDTDGRSALAVPLLFEDTAMGVITLIHSSQGHFTAEHAKFVQAIADQLATLLNNARQYQALVDNVQRLNELLDQREEEASKSMAIVRSIGDGVVVGDRMGRIRLINPAAEHILSIEASKYLGQSLLSLPGPTETNSTDQEQEDFQEFELNGRFVRASSTPVVTANQDWLGSVVVYHDVSAMHLADRLKTEFVATASHELRTPLTSIGGYIDLLLLNTLGPINDQQRQFLSVVRDNITRLTAILNDLLDMSRIESGHMRLQRRPLDLDTLLHNLVMEMHQQWSDKHISLALDIPSELPTIIADEDRVRQIIANLLSNAYKYTYDHGRIDLLVRNGHGKVVIEVHDTGVGIARHDQDHIFTRFYRTENPLKEQAGGTGLGLTITKSLVELHGGAIHFESQEGKGSSFIVELPIGGDAEWTPAAWLEGVD